MYAVVCTYSFDNDCAVYLFDSLDKAKDFLRETYEEEVRIDRDENGYDVDNEISEDGRYAKLIDHFEEICGEMEEDEEE